MKKINEVVNKYRNVLIVLMLGLVVVLAWATRKKEIKEVMTENKQTFEMLKIESLENKVTKINWNADKVEIPMTTAEIVNRTGKIGSAELLKLGEWLGGGEMLKSIDANGLLSYKNRQSGASIYVNLANNVVQFSRGFVDENYYSQKISDNDVRLAVNNFDNFTSNLNGWVEGGSWSEAEISYQKVLGPRAVTSDKNEANIIVIEKTMEFDGKKLYSSYGSMMVTARYGTEGGLLEVKMENPRVNLKEEGVVNLINWDEITKNNNRVKIFKIYGPEGFETSDQSDSIDEINITKTELGYVYSPEKNSFEPFLIGEGNCKLASGPARVRIGVWLQKD